MLKVHAQKRRGDVALDVAIDVPAPGVVALFGRSGCGKTTLLNCVSGLDRINGGSVHIDGTDLAALNDKQKTTYRARNMGFIFQFYNLLPVLTAAQNVELPLLLTKLSKKDRREHVIHALEIVGLSDRAEHFPGQLSGGQQQRVGVARAIVSDPTIILGDEPTGDLDSASGKDILDLLERLSREFGKTILMVTHDAHAAERAQDIMHMDKGVLSR
jgi:putative ABC transport system ATP-binding protein